MRINKKYGGVIVPVVSPLTEAFTLDEASVEKIMQHLHQHGAHPFILGTTGESASLSWEIKKTYVKKALQAKRPGMLLYAGISSNCIAESIDFGNFCADAGVDAVVATLPSYYALTDDGMKKYFTQLAESVRIPLIIYNIPATTHMSIPLPVIDALSNHPNIVALKDSERNDKRMQQSLQLWKKRNDFSYLLGWAARSVDSLTGGSDGLVPSTGNLAPDIYATMWKAVECGNTQQALDRQQLSDAVGGIYQSGKTLGQSLWALKVLMQSEGLCQPVVMPPLQPMAAEEAQRLISAWKEIRNKR